MFPFNRSGVQPIWGYTMTHIHIEISYCFQILSLSPFRVSSVLMAIRMVSMRKLFRPCGKHLRTWQPSSQQERSATRLWKQSWKRWSGGSFPRLVSSNLWGHFSTSIVVSEGQVFANGLETVRVKWHIFKVLRNGLLRYILYTCPNLWCNSCSKCYGMDCFGTYFTHIQTCDATRVQSATEWTASVHTLHISRPVM